MSKSFLTLLVLRVHQDPTVYRYQYYQASDYTYESNTYSYFPFNYVPSARNIDFESDEGKLVIPNNVLFRDEVESHDGLRRSVVEFIMIRPDLGSAVVNHERYVITDTVYSDAQIEFTLRSVVHALNARVPSVTFNSRDFGPLPRRNVTPRFR